MKYFSFVVFMSLVCLSAKAQSDSILVKATVDRLFDGFLRFDSAQVRSCFLPQADLKSISWNTKTNTGRVDQTPMPKFYEAIGTAVPNVQYIEKIHSVDIKIDRNMAVVWAPYTFFLSDKISQCGVNSITLAKVADGWKILQIIDSRSKENCQP